MTLILIVILVALAFEYINGFHDTANSIATVVSTKVLTPRQAVAMAALTNLLGALWGTAVAKTISSGLVHLESAKEHDSYTLEQFLTVWGMPADAAGRCAFFGAKSPCTLAVKSKDSGAVGLDVKLADHDTLTLTVTST